MDLRKQYFYKIYDSDGTYIGTQGDVINEFPTFTTEINSGVGELVIQYARSWKDYYASSDLELYNELKVIVNDKEDNAKQIYSGYLNTITLTKDNAGHEIVQCQYIGYVAELAVRLLEFSTGETALLYSSDDPTDILKDMIDKYDGKITYSATSIETTGNTITDVFNVNTVRDAIDILITRCPIGWFWYVDGENTIYLKVSDMENPDHTFIIGRHINNISMSETMENVRNDIRVIGGTPDGATRLYEKFYNSSSIRTFGQRTDVKNDGRLYNADSVAFLGKYLLGTQYSKEIAIEFDVLDSNISEDNGYDIESISVGDVIKIKDPQRNTIESLWDVSVWDVDYWDFNVKEMLGQNIIVQAINYYGTGCKITASRSVAGLGFRLEDVKRNLENFLNTQVPVEPTGETATAYEYNSDGELIDNEE